MQFVLFPFDRHHRPIVPVISFVAFDLFLAGHFASFSILFYFFIYFFGRRRTMKMP
jgi:hypothetical protein